MAQGTAKLGKARKSGGSQKRKTVRAKALNKGRKSFNVKGRKNNFAAKEEKATSKAINRKNESIIAAKAVSVGTKFFLGEITESGTKEFNSQLKARNKKQDNATKVSDRLKAQLKKLNGEI